MRNVWVALVLLIAGATPAGAMMQPLFPPDTCTKFYPPDAAGAHVEGQTMLAFEITQGGQTKDIRVIQSSGNADLDRAAQHCAAGFLYRALLAPVQWKARVVWGIGPKGPRSWTDSPHGCNNFRPKDVTVGGTTTLSFTVKADGYVDDIKVAKSSGNAELDDAAVKCAARWTYLPQTVDGKKVAAPWQAAVVWEIGRAHV